MTSSLSCHTALSVLLSHSIPSCCFTPCHHWLSPPIHGERRLLKEQKAFHRGSSSEKLSYSILCSRYSHRNAGNLRSHVCHGANNQEQQQQQQQEQEQKSSADEGQEGGGVSSSSDLQLALEQEGDWQWRKTARELVAYGLLLAAVPLGTLLPRLQYSGAFYFVFLALWSVYVGSHRSLQRSPPQKMSFQQGLAVPIVCSVSLFGFYCLLRFYPDLDLRTFISIYLGFAGSLAVASNLVGPVRYILPDKKSFSWKINIPQWLLQDDGQPVHFTLTAADCIAILVGIGAAITSKQAGAPFTLNNFIAVCIVTELLNLLSLGSFVTAAAMLCGLLLYDVFWVFGSPHVFGDNVMVMVATSTAFEGPMKLIFPMWKENAANMYSVLGLGDVAAPGLLIALMLRFDRSRSKNFGPNLIVEELAEVTPNQRPDKTYFVTCIASYLIGLAVTIAANSVSGAAQPALLYLVPSLLLGVFVMASYRSEASLLLDFKDEMPVGK